MMIVAEILRIRAASAIALRMVAGRERKHTAGALTRVELRQRVERAAKLEGAGTLEVLAFEKQLGAHALICGRRAQHRRAVSMTGNTLRGSDDIRIGR